MVECQGLTVVNDTLRHTPASTFEIGQNGLTITTQNGTILQHSIYASREQILVSYRLSYKYKNIKLPMFVDVRKTVHTKDQLIQS